ncbi:hypothetical protein HFO60_01265 [Rhizobium leguminosarum]|uniref:hypothetical protein n=1 Tax=Rhizobium leguminosarum TaxID=384 RepID=UPI001C959381|nr:hypothetical protein [Rhizobium leguminosarum]MBY5538710.1 hypothetical protein [Rhizobium leguminosarum]
MDLILASRPHGAGLIGQRIIKHIFRKTFGFNKLLDAFTLRSFTHGALENGQLQRNRYGHVISSGVGTEDKSNVGRELKSLIAKGLIDGAKSDWTGGTSYIFCALPIETAVELMLGHAHSRLLESYPARAPEIMEVVTAWVRDECEGLFVRADAKREHASNWHSSKIDRKSAALQPVVLGRQIGG